MYSKIASLILLSVTVNLPPVKALEVTLCQIVDVTKQERTQWTCDSVDLSSSTWDQKKEPMLLPFQAVAAATTDASRPTGLLRNVQLQRPINGNIDANVFFYMVSFDHYDCVVLLTGKVIAPHKLSLTKQLRANQQR